MIRLPRWFIIIIATMFVLSPAIIAVIELFRVGADTYSLIALALYVLLGLVSVLYFRELKMPLALAIGILVVSVAVPQLVNFRLDPAALGTPATWYVTGVSTLLAIAAVRQQRIVAWIGVAALVIEVLTWGGLGAAFVSGLGGAIALVAAAHAISVGLASSAKQTASYIETARATQMASAAESAMSQERSERITSTLEESLPMLAIIARGEFSSDDRVQAKLLEAELRDEIRGRDLINPELKAAVRAARSRGVDVVVLDEGGLATTGEKEREEFRHRLATELNRVVEGSVTIRSPRSERVRVTFVASRKGTAKPDVFLRL